MWVAEWVLVWVWRRFFRRQASTARPFSLNEFDGFREIGNESCALCLRDIWVTSNFTHVKKVIRGPGPMIVPLSNVH